MEQKIPLPNIPEPSEIPISPPVNSSSLKKPFLIVLLIVLLVILSSLGTYFFVKSQNSTQTVISSPTPVIQTSPTPTHDPTAGWKTYTDSKNGYSVKYPPQWHTNPPPLGPGILIGLNEPNGDQITIDISSTKNAIAANCKPIQLDTIPASRCENTQKITGERGVVYNPPIVSKTVYIETLHNGKYYSISLTFDQTSDKFKILDEMLPTFKFL